MGCGMPQRWVVRRPIKQERSDLLFATPFKNARLWWMKTLKLESLRDAGTDDAVRFPFRMC